MPKHFCGNVPPTMSKALIQHDPAKLVALLKEKGWNGADLSRATGLKQPSIWALLNGVTKMPKASTLIAVANALGVPLRDILKKPSGKQDSEELLDELLAAFAALEPANQRAVVAAAKALVGPPKPKRR